MDELMRLMQILQGIGMQGQTPQNTVQSPEARLDSILGTPFVQDTLQGIVGSEPSYITGNIPGDKAGQVYDLLIGNTTAMALDPNSGGEAALPHEFGHVFDVTEVAPDLYNKVVSHYDEAKENFPHQYGHTSKHEYFAEAFANALSTIRAVGPLKNTETAANLAGRFLEGAEQGLPGTGAVFTWLLQHPIFSSHPLSLNREGIPIGERREGFFESLF